MSRTATLSTDKKAAAEALHPTMVRPRYLFILLALVYFGAAGAAAWNIIIHTTESTTAIEKILVSYNMKNEGALAVDRYTHEHPFLGFLFGSPVKKELDLPSREKAQDDLTSGVKGLLKTVREESSIAAWWSEFLLSFSFLYVVTVIALDRSLVSRAVLFALTAVSVSYFFVGILAPAMIIWTAPTIPMESGQLSFVLQHQVRGIFAIIWDLLTNGHYIIGGFLFLFSIITPLTKASLTFFITGSRNRELNLKIGEFIHTIGKWSMADVFVAAVLLSLYALKFQEATKSIPCLGLYYFIGYCLFALTTTELLVHSDLADGNARRKSKKKLGLTLIGGLFAVFVCFAAATSVYTYEQYTENIKETIKAPSSPTQLDNAHLDLPAHKK